jgi:phage terminase large subunit
LRSEKLVNHKFPRAFEPLIKQRARYKFIRGGRGSAKSWSVARWFLIEATTARHRYLCTREVQHTLKQSVHQLLRDQIEKLGLGHFFTVTEAEIRGRNDSLFSFAGLSDLTADGLKSYEGYDRVWNEEGQTTSEESWGKLDPTIRVDGSEIWTTYNPELETDATHVRAVIDPMPDTMSIEMNWSDNPWFPASLEKVRAHAEKTMKPADYKHTWGGRCKPAVTGAIYFDEVSDAEEKGRFTRVPYDPHLKVHTIWDLGFNDSMALIFAQRLASEIRVIEYIEDQRRTIDSYHEERMRRWPQWNWGKDYLPHDGFAKRHQTGKSDAQVLRRLRNANEDEEKLVLRVPSIDIDGGIRRAREVFPRVYFNTESEGVKRLRECLKRYKRHINAKTREPGAPVHDEFSHGADDFRYLCLVADSLQNEPDVVDVASAIPLPMANHWGRR